MIAVGTTIQIAFSEQKAYLLNDHYLPLSQLNLGWKGTEYTVKYPTSWTIRVRALRDNGTIMIADVIQYDLPISEFSAQQNLLNKELHLVQEMHFPQLPTQCLLNTFRQINYIREKSNPDSLEYKHSFTTDAKKEIEIIRKIQESFTIPFRELQFVLGGVKFPVKLDGGKRPVIITIKNIELKEEFDAIRNYFSNVLKVKKINVEVKATLKGEAIVETEATSPQIDLINKEIIDNVKFEFVKKTIKHKFRTDIDQNLLTMEEYFSHFGEEKFNPNAFYNNEKEFFEDIIKIKETKHYHHLRFLSQHHAYNIIKLRFVHKPISFVFVLEGERHYHIVWETLDTKEATYIWHCDKTIQALKDHTRKIEDIINVVKVQGKTAYINSADDPFRRIYHDYSMMQNGFLKWKGELESVLT